MPFYFCANNRSLISLYGMLTHVLYIALATHVLLATSGKRLDFSYALMRCLLYDLCYLCLMCVVVLSTSTQFSSYISLFVDYFPDVFM